MSTEEEEKTYDVPTPFGFSVRMPWYEYRFFELLDEMSNNGWLHPLTYLSAASLMTREGYKLVA